MTEHEATGTNRAETAREGETSRITHSETALIKHSDLAALLGVSNKTLHGWRYRHRVSETLYGRAGWWYRDAVMAAIENRTLFIKTRRKRKATANA